MRKLLAASTALAVVGGVAFAEIMISGDAKFGIEYNSDPTDNTGDPDDNKSKHTFRHEMGVDISGSGTTDGGLTFGGRAGFDTGKTPNEGTVFISGSFGTITFGDNDSADKLSGGIADVGLNGIGVDDVVEGIHGTTANQFRYDQSFGNMSLAISAGTSNGVDGVANETVDDGLGGTPVPEFGELEVKRNSYAIGVSFSASGATVGFGYDSKESISAGFGYTTGQISANAFYAKGEKPYNHLGADFLPDNGFDNPIDRDGTFDAGLTGIGVDVTYVVGASALTLSYARTEVSNIQPIWDIADNFALTHGSASFKGFGVRFSQDLGGGAKLVAGLGQVPTTAVADLGMEEIGQVFDSDNEGTGITADDRVDLSGNRNVASVGLSFAF